MNILGCNIKIYNVICINIFLCSIYFYKFSHEQLLNHVKLFNVNETFLRTNGIYVNNFKLKIQFKYEQL